MNKIQNFIVDRGFRDCVDFLNELDMNVFMPNFLYSGSQHTTEEANNSRLITKIRWIIEAVNGHIKNWEYFRNIVHNKNIPHIGDDFRIVCAMLNSFRYPRYKTDINKEKNLAQSMLLKNHSINPLQNVVKGFSNRTKKNNKLNPEEINFPELSEEYLNELAFGSYQLKQSISYTTDHLSEGGTYEIEIFKEMENLIRIKISSRHSNKTCYNTFIQYSFDEVNLIKNWYCSCKAGARTIECCSHVFSVLWFLGFHLKTNKTKLVATNYLDDIIDAKLNGDAQLMSEDEE